MDLKSIVRQVIDSIQNTGIASTKSIIGILKENTFKVKVENPQKEIEVSGKVEVNNLQKIEQLLEKYMGTNAKEVTISNVEFLKLPKAQTSEVTIKNLKDFPVLEAVTVNNPQKSVEVNNLQIVVQALRALEQQIKKIDVKPEIKVDAPFIPAPVVNIPKQTAPIVTVNEKEVDLKDVKRMADLLDSLVGNSKKAMSVRLTDGKEFYKAVDRLAEAYTANNTSPFRDAGGTSARAVVGTNGGLNVNVVTSSTEADLIANNVTNGTITANGGTVTAAAVDGMAGWVMGYYGTYATGASLVMEVSFDGGLTYAAARMIAGATSTLGYVVTIAAVSNSQAYFYADMPAGATHLRVRCSAWAAPTGTINVVIGQSVERNSISTGAVSITAGTVTTVTTLTNITNWGNLVDNAAFVDGTTRLSPSAFILDEVAGTALSEDDAAAARIDSKRAQIGVIEDATTRGQRAAVSSGGALKIDTGSATGAAVPSNAFYGGMNDASGNLIGIKSLGAATSTGTANNNLLAISPYVYNGSTSDAIREAVNATNSTGTGIVAVGNLAQFDDTSPTSITENQFGNLRMSANRNLYVTIRDAAGNERGLNIDASGQLAVSVASLPSHAVTNAGTFAVQSTASAAGGYTPGKLVSAATTNATSVTAAATTLGYLTASNVNAAARYLKIYNKASAPTVGSDTPVATFIIPGNTAGAGTNIPLPPQGMALSTGFAFALTTEATDAGTTAVAANEIVVNYGFK